MENARIPRWKTPELILKGPGYRYRQPKNASRGSILLAPPARAFGRGLHSVISMRMILLFEKTWVAPHVSPPFSVGNV
eukprot:1177189-Prorocentrum_minimum.AAC.5